VFDYMVSSCVTRRMRICHLGSLSGEPYHSAQVVTTEDLSAWNDNKGEIDCEIADDNDREATQDTMFDSSELCSICLHDFGEYERRLGTKCCTLLYLTFSCRTWTGDSINKRLSAFLSSRMHPAMVDLKSQCRLSVLPSGHHHRS
jgi:hypothetical protein